MPMRVVNCRQPIENNRRFDEECRTNPSSASWDGIEMEDLLPRYINENESDNRGIKEGWYAMRRNGTVGLGPFSTRAECVTKIAQSTSETGGAPLSAWPA
jgi:hypothetical protein